MKFSLELACTTENVKEFGAIGEDFRYYIKIKCSQCGEVPEKFQYVCQSETVPTKTGRSTANMVGKCKNCAREYTINILPETVAPYKVDEDKPENYQSIVKFEVRGCEPVIFEPRIGWYISSSESSTKFQDVDLSEGDWADYDEKADVSLSLMEFKSRFVKA